MIVQYIDGFTNVLGAPKDWDPTKHGECLGLPVRTEAYGDSVSMTSAWKPSPDELAALLAGASINLRVIGGHPPVSLFVEGIGEDLRVAEPTAEDQRQMLMAKVLRLCGMQFEAYADLHAAKQTVDGDGKAATNRQYAKLCADVLEGLPPAATFGDGYSEFFYDLAKLMDIGARTQSPAEVWRSEMLPKLAKLLGADATGSMNQPRRWFSRELAPAEIRPAFDTKIVADIGEGNALAVCDTFAEFAPLLLEAAGMPTGKRIILPPHEASCHVTHNNHKSYYETVQQLIDSDSSFFSADDFVSPEERDRAIATNELWTVQWYPDTPVGFCVAHASSLEALNAYFDAEQVKAPAVTQ